VKSKKGYKQERQNSGKQQGFTLLEILTVLTIISILAMIAIPTYLSFRTRSKVAGEIVLIDPVKDRLVEEYLSNGKWPANNNDAFLKDKSSYHGNYLQSVEISDKPVPGSIILTYDTSKLPSLGTNNTIIFYPAVDSKTNIVNWSCDKGTIEDTYRPPRCR
jgi:type IV pilus assembly protein PilA